MTELLAQVIRVRMPETQTTKTAPDPSLRASPTRARIALWFATATLTGGVIMVLELVAFRLYAPYFGYSSTFGAA